MQLRAVAKEDRMTPSPAVAAPRILVATDFSDEAEAAVRVAIDYARRLGAHLDILHVYAAGEIGVTTLLADAAAPASPDVPVTVASTGGDPAEEILRYAARQPIDLIVVGTHGRTGVSRLLLGSVAERVLRGAHCPVLAVPARLEPPVHEAESELVATLRPCLVCATPSSDLVCAACRARIRGEALGRKQREERAGRV
jgi:nucleotide-binding universal stress UspA family protein